MHEIKLREFEKQGAEEDVGPKKEQVTGNWRKRFKILHNLYFSSNTIRVMK